MSDTVYQHYFIFYLSLTQPNCGSLTTLIFREEHQGSDDSQSW